MDVQAFYKALSKVLGEKTNTEIKIKVEAKGDDDCEKWDKSNGNNYTRRVQDIN